MADRQINKKLRIVSWIAQLVAAFILGQAAIFKLSGAPEASQMFVMLGAAMVLLLVFAVSTRSRGVAFISEEAGAVFDGARIKADRSSRVVQVLGPTPRSVLRAFCATSDRGQYEPLSVTPSGPLAATNAFILATTPSSPTA